MASWTHAAAPHPLYVSITEMNYNEQAHTIEISCKIFTDDLEKAVALKTGKPLHISEKAQQATTAAIAAYLAGHFGLRVDGRPVSLRYLGYEVEKEAVWSYLEGRVAAVPHTTEITNSILYDAFDQQINLVHVMVRGQRQSGRLNNPDTKMTLRF